MIALLPWLLLATTATGRFALARKWRWRFYLDPLTVAPWLAFYALAEAYPLMAVPLCFGFLDIKGLTKWWTA